MLGGLDYVQGDNFRKNSTAASEAARGEQNICIGQQP